MPRRAKRTFSDAVDVEIDASVLGGRERLVQERQVVLEEASRIHDELVRIEIFLVFR
jgi:hypothetical protein